MTRRVVRGLGLLVAVVACARDPVQPPQPEFQVLPPPCVQPAPLLGAYEPRAPGLIVAFHDSVDVATEVPRLAARFEFTPTHVYQYAIRGFAALLNPAAVAGIRCESTVASVEYDGLAFPDGP